MSLLLGIDEGTSAVKAVLFDERPARRSRGAPREGARPPAARLGRAGPRGGAGRGGRGGRRAARGRARQVAACGLDHQGESVLAWDAESGAPLTPIVTWQDKRSQEVLDRLEAEGRADEIRERSGMPLDPYFSAGKLAWLLEHDDAVADGGRRGHAAARHGRLVPLRPARRRLRDRPLDRVAHPARRAGVGPGAARDLRRAARGAAARSMDTAGDLGTLQPRLVAGRAAAARALRRPAGGARRRRLRRAGPGQGDLRDRRVRARPRRRPSARSPAAACCPPSPGASTGGSSGRSTAASSPPARCSSG